MRKSLVLGALAAVASVATLSSAFANVVKGTGYETTPALSGDATPASFAAAAAAAGPGVTFSAPSDPLNFNSNGSTDYTLGSFLATGDASPITYFGGAKATDTLDNTLFQFVGTVSVTSGEKFTFSHDDGLTFSIGSDLVVNAPGPTSAVTTTGTYTGPSGNEPFVLTYAETDGAPAVLNVDLPLTSSVPEPSTWAMMIIGFAGLGFARYRQASKARVIVSSS
jgi:hypothetical protein